MREQVNEQYKKLQHEVRENAHKAWLFGLGTYSWVEEEGKDLVQDGRKWFNELVERGRGMETRSKKEVDKVRKEAKKEVDTLRTRVEKSVDEIGEKVDKQVTEVLHRMGIPTRHEIQILTRRVEELTARLEGKAVEKKTVKRKVYHVVTADEGWKVELEGSTKPLATYPTKDEALDGARDVAQANEPSQVVVHRMDGTIQTNYTYDPTADA
jgi:poly(hydroxyalkanoate) granule-associated protein